MELPIGPFPFGRLERQIAAAFALIVVAMRLFAHWMTVPWALVMLAGLLPFLLMLVPGRALFGRDGVLLEWLGVRRFIPAREIEDAVVVSAAIVEVALSDGSAVAIPTARARAADVADRLRALKRRHEASADAQHELLLDGRGSREHVARLRVLGLQAGSARTSAICADGLWEVFESPAATPTARAAALVALKHTLDEEGLERVRVALAGVASPTLRAAIERCAISEDDEEIACVIGKIE